MLTYIHSPHTLGRILLPIIDDGCYFGEFIEELGRSRVPMVNKELAKRKGKKKNEQKGGRRKAFFSGLAVLKFLTKVIMLLMNISCQNITYCSSG